MDAVQPRVNVRAHDDQDAAAAQVLEEEINLHRRFGKIGRWLCHYDFDRFFSDLKTKETEMDCATNQRADANPKSADLTKKFYVVMATDRYGGRHFGAPMTREEAEKHAKWVGSQDPSVQAFILESVSVSTLGKVRTSALKPAPKPKKVKPLKVKRGTPIEYVD